MGFGDVNRALVRLLLDRSPELRSQSQTPVLIGFNSECPAVGVKVPLSIAAGKVSWQLLASS
jgi:hypothetical protein